MRPPTRTAPAPVTVVPMQPTLVARPFNVEGFVYEEKVDGYRMIAYKIGDTVGDVLPAELSECSARGVGSEVALVSVPKQ